MGAHSKRKVGETFNNGNLVVVDVCDKKGYVKVRCLVCAKDNELFGEAVYQATISGLRAGKQPCGCSKNYRWTLPQYEIRIKRKIEDESLPVKFIGFGVTKSGLGDTPVRLLCTRLGTKFSISSISKFLAGRGNSGIPHSVAEVIANYNNINSNSVVWDCGKKNITGNAICGFYCKTCESNGFESLFQVELCILQRGGSPCYCSGSKMNISGGHIVELTKRKLNEQSLNYISVLGAVKKGAFWHSTFVCELHGAYSVAYSNLDSRGCHCLKCTPPATGYKTVKRGYFYLLDIQTTTGTILGYGITNKLNARISTHKMKLSRIGATITNIQVFEGSGTAVLAVENAIKVLHPTGLLDCEGFRRESISIDRKEEVLELCKKLKVLDNTDKLI